MLIMINAGGDGTRFAQTAPPGTGSKEVQLIQGEPIIARTVRQLHERGLHDIIIMSHKQDVIDATPAATHFTRHSLMTVWYAYKHRDIWQAANIVLLGDVIFSDGALDEIVRGAQAYPMRWVGFNNEHFAFSWTPSSYVEKLFRQTIEAAPHRAGRSSGKYVSMYELHTGYKWWTKHRWLDRTELANDGTVDIDDWPRYQAALAFWG